MNQWPIYSYLKVTSQKTGYVPTYEDVLAQFPSASLLEMVEGTYEFLLAYGANVTRYY